ncbi:MAG: Gfo/Idh/MocA family oxidoreductase [Phycisphaerales bacterium]
MRPTDRSRITRPTRRAFLKTTAGAAAVGVFGFPNILRAGAGERLNIAVVGTMNQAWWNIQQIKGENIVALCDVDANGLARAAEAFPGAKTYRDFRVMLERQKDIDAVLVATPDHIHGPAAAMALRTGRHCYCEKPLAHSVHETRVLTKLAKETGLATQMGTQIHAGDNYRRVVELIQAGTIGPVREAYVWCGKSWSGGRFGPAVDPPAHLDWDLWLGPARERPYSEGLHPANWRSFWEYGTGTLGDMACHYMDLVHWALDLGRPTRVEVEGPEPHSVGTPAWLIVRCDHPEKDGRPPVTTTWYDGGKRPALFDELRNADETKLEWGDGHLFVGDTGMIISDYGRHFVLRDGKVSDDFERPEPTIPRSIGHHAEWIEACKAGTPTTCHFGYSGPLTEAVLLGNVAFRAGVSIDLDPARAGGPSSESAVEELIRPPMRAGWEV